MKTAKKSSGSGIKTPGETGSGAKKPVSKRASARLKDAYAALGPIFECIDYREALRALLLVCKKTADVERGVFIMSEEGGGATILGESDGALRTLSHGPAEGFFRAVYEKGPFTYTAEGGIEKLRPALPLDIDDFADCREILTVPIETGDGGRDDKKIVLCLMDKPGGISASDVGAVDALCRFSACALERCRMLERFEHGEERFKSVVEASRNAIITINNSGNVIFWNMAAQNMFGYTAEEITGKSITAIIPQRLRAAHKKGLKNMLATGKGKILGNTIEITGLRKDGSEVPVEMTLSGWRAKNGDGDKMSFTGIMHDISERKQIENSLVESEERFHQIFVQNEDAIIVYNPRNCGVIDVNPAAVKILGYSKDELIEHGPLLFLRDSDAEKYMSESCEICMKDGAFIDQKTLIRKNGSPVTVAIKGKKIKLRQTDVIYCTYRDITEKVQLQLEAELRQAQLIHADKMKSLGMLVASVTHEISNPNNFIMFNAPMLGDIWADALKVLDEYRAENGTFMLGGLTFEEARRAVPELLTGMADGAYRIKNIVGELKNFSRRDTDGLSGTIDINKAVMSAATILSFQIKSKTEKFHLHCENNLPAVRGSAQKIEQVVINLITNALQSLPGVKSGIYITTAFDEAASSVSIKVRDEGAGIPVEVMKRIMEPFFTTHLSDGGTGLGLTISYAIVKEHGGTLILESEPGAGTTATIRLPALKAERPRGDVEK
jgi:hypothetical protein